MISIDKPTSVRDLYNANFQEMLSFSADHGSIFKYLLPISILSQKMTQNIPIISFINENKETQSLNLSDYANEYFRDQQGFKFNTWLDKLFEAKIIDKATVTNLIKEVNLGL